MEDLQSVPTIEDPEIQRIQVMLVLDASGSMEQEDKIGKMNEAISYLKVECLHEESLADSVEIAIVKFGGIAQTVLDFTPIKDADIPTLGASGGTPMAEAIRKSMDLIENRKEVFKNQDVNYFRPMFFLITDGLPTDMGSKSSDSGNLKSEFENIRNELQTAIIEYHFYFQPVGVKPADMDFLKSLCPNEQVLKSKGIDPIYPIELKGQNWKELIKFFKNSIHAEVKGQKQSEVSPGEAGEKYLG